LIFEASVLWQQGGTPTRQPVEDDNFILLFNGDIYMDWEGKTDQSDTEYLFNLIKSTKTEEEFVDVFKKLRGPFSLICYSKIYKDVPQK
jgi:asparagine synthetase B (glutamine-hydrolysing)